MAYILQGVLGGGTTKRGTRGAIRVSGVLGDDAKKAQIQQATLQARSSSTPGSGSSSTSTGGDGKDDGKIFGLPPVVVAGGAAVLGYFAVRFIQRKRAR